MSLSMPVRDKGTSCSMRDEGQSELSTGCANQAHPQFFPLSTSLHFKPYPTFLPSLELSTHPFDPFSLFPLI